jgi:hypothetical protein
MTLLADLFTWTLVAALAVASAGMQKKKPSEIQIATVSFDRGSAFWVVGVIYFVVTLIGLIVLWRLEALLRLLPDANFVKGYSKLASHEWVMNPFSYLGTTEAARRSASFGAGLLIVAWWFCLGSVVSLRGEIPLWKSLVTFPLLFYLAGLSFLWVIWDIYRVNLDRLFLLAPDIHGGLKDTAGDRWLVIYLAIPVGFLIFIGVLKLPRLLGIVRLDKTTIEPARRSESNVS